MPNVILISEGMVEPMKRIQDVAKRPSRPLKVVQFGEGNFLRAFVDYMIDIANERGVFDGSVAIVKPIAVGNLERFERQDCLYTVNLRGKQNGEVVNTSRVITCVDRTLGCYEDFEAFLTLAKEPTLSFVVSNTTEAGIVPDSCAVMEGVPATYPGKLVRFLYERFLHFGGDVEKGLILLPVELIEKNGTRLKEAVWKLAVENGLGEAFLSYLEEACVFCNTLVDRIVTGYPREEADEICHALGYTDELLDVAEPYGLWVIESQTDIAEKFPLDKAGLPVVFTDDLTPYRERKVRILNGAHTSTVLFGWLAGLETVGECMKDPLVRAFMERAIREEVMPFVRLPEDEVKAFAEAVFERFENPFLRHKVLDISLNSVSKWKTRVLPSFKDYIQTHHSLPPCLTFSFAALMAFYTAVSLENGVLVASREDGTCYTVRDDEAVLRAFFAAAKLSRADYVKEIASRSDFWGEDLSACPGFCETVTELLTQIQKTGICSAAERLLRGV